MAKYFLIFFLVSVFYATANGNHNVRLVNQCSSTIIAHARKNGDGGDSNTWTIGQGQSVSANYPTGWAGRFWARYQSTGPIPGWPQPDTLAEIKFDGWQGLDFYDISLVDGFSLPMTFAARSGCRTISCKANFAAICPNELKQMQSGKMVACNSACTKFHKDEYCCTGSHNKPETCPPTNYSKIFKQACPDAYSYAYDDATSTFTCSNSGGPNSYTITFC